MLFHLLPHLKLFLHGNSVRFFFLFSLRSPTQQLCFILFNITLKIGGQQTRYYVRSIILFFWREKKSFFWKKILSKRHFSRIFLTLTEWKFVKVLSVSDENIILVKFYVQSVRYKLKFPAILKRKKIIDLKKKLRRKSFYGFSWKSRWCDENLFENRV